MTTVIVAELFRATFANLAKNTGKLLFVVDKRPHIVGTYYTESTKGVDVIERAMAVAVAELSTKKT